MEAAIATRNRAWPTATACATALLLAAACGEWRSDTASKPRPPNPMASSEKVIGVVPQEATRTETEQTAPVAPNVNALAKSVEQAAQPMPGQPNDHSNEAKAPSQKAEAEPVLKSAPAARQANNG